MPRIELAPAVLEDFEHILAHLAQFEGSDGPARIAGIVQALDLLAASPEIGRPARGGVRELVIGRGAKGYVALYRFVPSLDTVFVLAVRAQRERGYRLDP